MLAIDDDEDVLAITVVMLEQCGLEVAAFLSGDEAVAELMQRPDRYGCAIVDLTMPVKDGVSVTRELRQIVPDLPVLFVSGYSKEQAAELVATNESTQFLRKPFRVEALNRALGQLLGGQ
ncbi:MAG: response regulator [Rhodanobacteraceae bacterium]|nr:response regulator [Rhodanobacteraceae bacterium]